MISMKALHKLYLESDISIGIDGSRCKFVTSKTLFDSYSGDTIQQPIYLEPDLMRDVAMELLSWVEVLESASVKSTPSDIHQVGALKEQIVDMLVKTRDYSANDVASFHADVACVCNEEGISHAPLINEIAKQVDERIPANRRACFNKVMGDD